MSTELTELHQRSKHPTPPSPQPPTSPSTSTNTNEQPHHNTNSYPLYHPLYKQLPLQEDERINHWLDLKKFIISYWHSFILTMWGLFIRTPIDFGHEVKYFVKNPKVVLTEILCGLTIAIVVVPESISFAYMLEMSPTTGLHTTFFICLACAILGATPAMISGSAASTFSILAALAKDTKFKNEFTIEQRHDLIYMSTIIAGVFEIFLSITRLAPYIVKVLPQSVLIGFCNGLAISIARSQFHIFEKCKPIEEPINSGIYITPPFHNCPEGNLVWFNFGELELWLVLILLFISVIIIFSWAKVPKIGTIIPASLIAIIISTLIEHLIYRKAFGVQTRTLKETTPLSNTPPIFHIPKVTTTATINPWGQVVLYALYTGIVGCIESLFTTIAMNQYLRKPTTDAQLNREIFAQGVGGVLCGVFKSVTASSTLGESLLNLTNNARHRLSAIVSGLTILMVVLFASPAVNLIPMATLAAVIVCITYHTFYWRTFIIWLHIRKSDVIIIIAVTVISVFTNLGIATLVGIGIGALTLVLDSYNAFKVDFDDIDVVIPGLKMKQNNMNECGGNSGDSGNGNNEQKMDHGENNNNNNVNNTNDNDNSQNNTNNNSFNDQIASPSNINHTSTNNIELTQTSSMMVDDITHQSMNNDNIDIANQPIGDIDSTQPKQDQDSTIIAITDNNIGTINNNPQINSYNNNTNNTPSSTQITTTTIKNDGQGIYSIEQYLEIDNYICHHYFPPQLTIFNPGHYEQEDNDRDNGDIKDNEQEIKLTTTQDITHNNDSNDIDINTPSNIDITTTTLPQSQSEQQQVQQEQQQQSINTIPNLTMNTQPNPHNNTTTTTNPSTTLTTTTTQNDNDINNNYINVTNDEIPVTIPVRIHHLYGILFFGSVRAMTSQITPSSDPNFIILDCGDLILTDFSASAALSTLIHFYSAENKRCKLVYVNSQSSKTISRDKQLCKMISRIDRSTFIAYTANELKQRKELKVQNKKLQKKLKKEQEQQFKQQGEKQQDGQ